MLSASRPARENPPQSGLRLRPGTMVTACFLALAAIALAYVGGVMTGRASAAKQRPPVPQTAQAGTSRSEAPSVPLAEQTILAPAELGFVRALRSDEATAQETPPPAMTPARPPLPAGAGSGPSAAEGQAPGQSVEQFGGQSGAGQPPLASAVGGAPLATAALHDYVFQVAAFRDEDSVDALRQRLEGYGLRTRMQREGKLYLVRVLLRGNAERAGELVNLLESMRLGKPILISRKAVVLP